MTERALAGFPVALLLFWLRRITLLWGLAALVIFGMQLAVAAIVHDNANVQSLLQFLDMLPSIIKTAIGGDTLKVGNVTALIAIGYQHPLVLLLFLLFAVAVPTSLLPGEVQNGTMELILSRQVTKLQAYLCVTVLTFVGLGLLVGVMYLGTITATALYDFGAPVDLPFFLRLAVNGGLLAVAAGSIALLSSGGCNARGTAVAWAVAFLVSNYFLGLVTQWWPPMQSLEWLTLFHYVGGRELVQGWPVVNLVVLSGLSATATVLGGVLWVHRDLPH